MKDKKDKENFFKRFTDLILLLTLSLLFFGLGIVGLLNKQDYKLYDLLYSITLCRIPFIHINSL